MNSIRQSELPGATLAPSPTARTSLHVLTLTPFFPSLEDPVQGSFVQEPLITLQGLNIVSNVIGVNPIYHARRHGNPSAPAIWVRYPQIPGINGLVSAGRFLFVRVRGTVEKLHRERPIDVIHAHGALPCGHAASLLGRTLDLPFVVSVHGLDVFNAGSGDGAPAGRRRHASIGVYRQAHAVICVSEHIRQILHDGILSGVCGTVVYNGADPERFSPAPPPGSTRRLLAVGNLIPTKGQDLVLRALAELQNEFPQIECRFIGDGPERRRLEALAVELGVLPRVQFLGRQSRAEVAEAMRSCSMFVLPSRSEGLGCVYLEAMACAKPAVGCRGQGIEEIIRSEQNGWLISPSSLDELVHALSTLLRSSELAARIGDAARQTILDGFTLEHQARKLSAIYADAAYKRSADTATTHSPL